MLKPEKVPPKGLDLFNFPTAAGQGIAARLKY